MGNAVIFSGDFVKTLKDKIKLGKTARIVTGTVDPTSVATDGEKGSMFFRQTAAGDGSIYFKLDNGISINWKKVESRGTIGITIDNGINPIVIGQKGYATVPYNCVITKWYITADKVGDIVVDVWKAASAIPTVANTITGTEKPTLTAQQLSSDTNLTTWNTVINAEDVVGFNVDSISGVSRITLVIEVVK